MGTEATSTTGNTAGAGEGGGAVDPSVSGAAVTGAVETGAGQGSKATGSVDGGGAEGGAATGAGEGGTPPTGEAGREDPVTKRFARLTRERDEALARDQRSREELSTALDVLKKLGGAPKDPVKDPAAATAESHHEEELAPPEFVDIDQYQRDMAVYTQKMTERTVQRELKAAETRRATEEANARAMAAQQERGNAWIQRRKAMIESTPDYEIVAESPDVDVSPAMAMGITGHEHGPKIAYYLGQHPEEAAKISKLAPELALMELGAIAAKVTAPPPPPKTSTAAAPLSTLKPSDEAARQPDVGELSMEEYAAQRRANMKR